MSNYSAPTRHPVTGAIEMADWLDDHDGKHRYGVRFPSDGKIYGGHECVEVKPREMMDEIERLQVTMDVLLADRRATLSENHDLWREIERLREAHATLGDQTWGRER
jgi:hypothetical protein